MKKRLESLMGTGGTMGIGEDEEEEDEDNEAETESMLRLMQEIK
jgi:hypothetical protein